MNAFTRDERLKLIRKQAADLMRSVRADWPDLKGEWTRREWNKQARIAGRHYIKNTLHFDRVNRRVS